MENNTIVELVIESNALKSSCHIITSPQFARNSSLDVPAPKPTHKARPANRKIISAKTAVTYMRTAYGLRQGMEIYDTSIDEVRRMWTRKLTNSSAKHPQGKPSQTATTKKRPRSIRKAPLAKKTKCNGSTNVKDKVQTMDDTCPLI